MLASFGFTNYDFNIMYMYTDAHCHIKPTAKVPDNIVGRICNATNLAEWEQFLGTSFDGVNFSCVGIHPWYVENLNQGWQAEMQNILELNPTIMVGEIGLDKFKPDLEKQIEVFKTQLEIASVLARPVHLHCVGAWDKVLGLLKNHNLPPVIIAHAFSGANDQIQILADKYNMYFSYSNAHTDGKFSERVAATPSDRLLIETDTFDAESELEILRSASDTIASIRGCTTDEIVEQTYQNFQKVISYVRPID